MTLKHLKIFAEVCRYQSVTRAAEELYLSQPAVSLAIREMEEHYGQKLFERISRKMYVTDAGKALLAFAGEILEKTEEMEQKLKNQDYRKVLKIGASMTMGTFYLPEAVRNFRNRYPDTEIQVQVNSSDLLEDKVLKNELDFCFIEGAAHAEMLRKEELGEDALCVVCSPDSPLAARKNLRLEDLKEEPFLLREKNSGTREVTDSVFLLHNFSVVPLWESTSTLALVRAAAAGLGITIVPSQFVEKEEAAGTVVRLKPKDAHFVRKYQAICHKNKQKTKEAEDLIQAVRKVIHAAGR